MESEKEERKQKERRKGETGWIGARMGRRPKGWREGRQAEKKEREKKI